MKNGLIAASLQLPVFLLFALTSTPTSSAANGVFNPNIFVDLSKKLVPSVVNISATSTPPASARGAKRVQPFGGGGPGSPDDLLRRFFEDMLRQRNGGGGEEEPEDFGRGFGASLGTGFIIDSEGLILTNNHVVAGADEIKIRFTEEDDEKPTDGEVIGRDPELDLALIKVKTNRKLIAADLGDSDSLEVGEYVLAIGNPFGQGHSVTHGIISAKGRDAPGLILANYIQTDAPINPGNSGGPLVNLKGEVIGINNAIDARAQGIGFAIPIKLAKSVLPQLRSKGSVDRGYIGANIDQLVPEIAAKFGVERNLKAPFVTHVVPGAPADLAGVKPYDVVLEFNGKKVSTPSELIQQVTSVGVGQTVAIKVLRSGQSRNLKITLTSRPVAGMPKGEKQKQEKRKQDKKSKPKIDLGMDLESMTPEIAAELGLPTDKSKSGVVISGIAYGGPADRAGLSRGDVILEIDQKPVTDLEDFENKLDAKKTYMLRVRRGDPKGESHFVAILDLN